MWDFLFFYISHYLKQSTDSSYYYQVAVDYFFLQGFSNFIELKFLIVVLYTREKLLRRIDSEILNFFACSIFCSLTFSQHTHWSLWDANFWFYLTLILFSDLLSVLLSLPISIFQAEIEKVKKRRAERAIEKAQHEEEMVEFHVPVFTRRWIRKW